MRLSLSISGTTRALQPRGLQARIRPVFAARQKRAVRIYPPPGWFIGTLERVGVDLAAYSLAFAFASAARLTKCLRTSTWTWARVEIRSHDDIRGAAAAREEVWRYTQIIQLVTSYQLKKEGSLRVSGSGRGLT